MSKLRLIRDAVSKDLFAEVNANLDLYRKGDFAFLSDDASTFIESDFSFDGSKLIAVDCAMNDHNEVNCCLNIFGALENLSPALARDGRLWTYLTHTLLLNYSRKRWPIPDDDAKAVSYIRNHYFAVGARGIERENAGSRLWWMAALCNRVDGLTLQESLTVFLHQTDVRANIIERPTTSQSVPVFSAVIRKLAESYRGNRELFERDRFRSLMKDLNLRGGVKLLEILPAEEISEIVKVGDR